MKKVIVSAVLMVVCCVALTVNLYGQKDGEVFVVRAMVCDSVGTAIKDAAVYDAKNDLRSITDQDGVARIATHLGETLYFSHLSFKAEAVRIKKDLLVADGEGHYSMVVVMRLKNTTLHEVTITENAPHLAYANKMVWGIDYKVQHDGIYMIAGNSEESVLLHVSFEQDTISRRPIAHKYQELYRDAFGNLHLIGPDSTYQIYCDGEHLHLTHGCQKELFRQKLEPVKILTDSIMVLQSYYNMQQQLAYLMVNRNTKQISIMANLEGAAAEMARNARRDAIRDQKIDMMHAEFQENPQAEGRLERAGALSMQRMEMNYGSDDIDVEERKRMVNSLFNRILYKPIYCPAFYLRDTIYVFDFQNDKMLKFDHRGCQTATYDIDFHRTGYFKNLLINNTWDNNLIVDYATNQCYAQFSSDGIVTLKEIDLNDGKVKREIPLTDHSFPQNIQVYDGNVYYLYLDRTRVVNKDKRSLYKMMLK